MKQQVGTIVGSSVHLTGAIKDASDIQIFGSVEGEVSSEQKVIIEESAYVKGPINASEVVISGNVNGTITAKERIELNPTGSIKGNIETNNLLIHSGATFIGKSTMPEKNVEGSQGKDFDFEKEEGGEVDAEKEKEEQEEE